MEMKIQEAARLILPAILAYLQLLYQGGGGGGFNSHTISLFVTISLLSLTAVMPLPSCKFLKISIFSVIVVCALILSSSVPAKLKWLPYLSGIPPFFHLLPDPFQHRFLRFAQTLWNKADQPMRAAIKLLVSPVASTPPLSSSSQEEASVEDVILEV